MLSRTFVSDITPCVYSQFWCFHWETALSILMRMKETTLNPSGASKLLTGSVYFLKLDCSRAVQSNTIETCITQLFTFCCTAFLVLASRQVDCLLHRPHVWKWKKKYKTKNKEAGKNSFGSILEEVSRLSMFYVARLTGVDWQSRETRYCWNRNKCTKTFSTKLGLQRPNVLHKQGSVPIK